MKSININPNITLHYIQMTKLKTATVGMYIHRALNEAEVSKNAILPYVLKRGCKLCPGSEAIAKYLENLYGAKLSAHSLKLGGDHIIYFGTESISDRYVPDGAELIQDSVKLLMSVIFEPVSFDEKIIAQEKKNARDRILAELNNKIVYAQQQCIKAMCSGDNFALSPLGTNEGIDEITADGLKTYYESIINASAIDIYVCGDCDIDAVCENVKEYTNNMSFTPSKPPETKMLNGADEVKRVTEHMDVAQGKLSMGFKTGISPDSSDYPALMVMNSVYGGGAHSKLFNNVREKLSLCYYASSGLIKDKGIMIVNAGIEFENFQKAYDEINAQLDTIKNGDISELEFNSSVRAIINDLEAYKDNHRLMQLFYLGQKVSGTNYDINMLKEKIRSVTVDDVKCAAQNVQLDTVYFLAGKED